jgi:hypothetical protein
MKKLITMAILLACATLAVASAAQSPASQAGQMTTSMSGSLTEKGGKFFLKDEASHSTVEVRGEGLQSYVGQNVNLTGQVVPGSTGSPEILIVSEVSRKVAGVATGKAAAAGVKAGLSKAVVIGAAGGGTAATVGSLYAADVIGGSEKSVSGR